jgi:hypothetical protein
MEEELKVAGLTSWVGYRRRQKRRNGLKTIFDVRDLKGDWIH